MPVQIIPTAEPFFFRGSQTGCLLVHGFTGAPKEMRWLGENLASQGHSVLGVRLAAHATHPEDMRRARWQDWQASVEDGWHLLSGCCNQIFLIGLSMGGILALTLAADLPAAGVVAMATPHHLPRDARLPFVKALSLLRPFVSKGEPDWQDPAGLEGHVCYPQDPTRSYAELRALIDVMQAALPRLHIPALLIYSLDDKVVRPEDGHMQLIFDALGSADKQTLTLQGSGHVLTCDARRQQVFEATQAFIQRLGPQPPCAAT